MQPTPPPVPFKVIAAVDYSQQTPGVLKRALSIANLSPRSEVHVVSVGDVVGPGGGPTEEAIRRLQEVTSLAVEAWTAGGRVLQVGHVITHALHGDPADEVVWLAAYLDADLVVVGTHRKEGLTRTVLGTVASEILRTCGCPVIAERPKAHDRTWVEPQIEPPCAACVSARQASAGATMWCARHAEHHPHPHVYSWSGSADGAEPWGFTG